MYSFFKSDLKFKMWMFTKGLCRKDGWFHFCSVLPGQSHNTTPHWQCIETKNYTFQICFCPFPFFFYCQFPTYLELPCLVLLARRIKDIHFSPLYLNTFSLPPIGNAFRQTIHISELFLSEMSIYPFMLVNPLHMYYIPYKLLCLSFFLYLLYFP